MVTWLFLWPEQENIGIHHTPLSKSSISHSSDYENFIGSGDFNAEICNILMSGL